MTTEAPRNPCWDGDSPSSSEIWGSNKPKMNIVASAVADPDVSEPSTTHL